MELTLGLFVVIAVLAFVCEFIDSSLGMGYGTILSPVLILMGFDPAVVVPAVLVTQAAGGLSATAYHHRYANADFSPGSRDLRVVVLLSSLGILATVAAAFLSVNVPKGVIRAYIGTLILLVGIVMLTNRQFRFSWRKMVGVGLLSAFNKGISGGGFGPIVTGGQVISGQNHKNAIGVTTFAEGPICVAGFLGYLLAAADKASSVDLWHLPVSRFFEVCAHAVEWELVLAMGVGAMMAAPVGPLFTRSMNSRWTVPVLGAVIAALGVLTLVFRVKP